jgi:hypothetical protein
MKANTSACDNPPNFNACMPNRQVQKTNQSTDGFKKQINLYIPTDQSTDVIKHSRQVQEVV